jgi:hypothetical protein
MIDASASLLQLGCPVHKFPDVGKWDVFHSLGLIFHNAVLGLKVAGKAFSHNILLFMTRAAVGIAAASALLIPS